MRETDVVIVGAGPVGLFAVFECGMLKMRTHVFDALDLPGGQCAALYPEKPIYDVPGYPKIEALALVEKLAEQAAPFEPVYHLGSPVTELSGIDGGFQLSTAAGVSVAAKAVIVAAGVGAFGPNRPPLAGIDAYEGSSVFYSVKKMESLRGRDILIVGGGDSALDWTLNLHPLARSLTLLHRRDDFRAAPDSVRKMRDLVATGKMAFKLRSGRIELIIPYQLAGLEGEEGGLSRVVVADLDGKCRALEADCLLPFFGLSMNLGVIAEWGLNLDRNHIMVAPATCATSVPGIFAIGDIATYPGKLKLILSGFAEAAQAAHAIYPLVHPGEALHFEYSTTKGVPGRT